MCEVDYMNLGLSIPALRGAQGGRDLYVTLPSNSVINTFFPTHIESSDAGPSHQIVAGKVEKIANYIEDKRDGYVLGAITYATDSECEFDEAFPGSQFGVLRLPLNAKLRTIDGQHRREALRTAVEVFSQVSSEHTTLMLYVEPNLERRREMFADMNSPERRAAESRPAPTSDPFESAAISLSTEHPFLSGRVFSNFHRPERGQFGYEMGEVIDALKRLFVGPTGRVKSPFRYDRSLIEQRGWEFFDSLSRSQLGTLVAENTTSVVRWPNALKVLAAVTWKLRFDDLGPRMSDESWTTAIDEVDFAPSGGAWVSSGLSDGTHPMIGAKRPQVIAAVDSLVVEMTERHKPSAETVDETRIPV